MPKPCDSYDIWDYDFKIQFAGTSDYFRISLASFAATIDYESVETCAIFIEELTEEYGDSRQIVFGSMFLTSVYT